MKTSWEETLYLIIFVMSIYDLFYLIPPVYMRSVRKQELDQDEERVNEVEKGKGGWKIGRRKRKMKM